MMFHCAWVRSIPTIDHRLTSLRIPDVLPIWFRCLGAAVVFVRRALVPFYRGFEGFTVTVTWVEDRRATVGFGE